MFLFINSYIQGGWDSFGTAARVWGVPPGFSTAISLIFDCPSRVTEFPCSLLRIPRFFPYPKGIKEKVGSDCQKMVSANCQKMANSDLYREGECKLSEMAGPDCQK